MHGHDREGKCAMCNCSIKLYRKLRGGKYDKNPFTHCVECWKKQTAQSKPQNTDSDQVKESSAVSFEISTAHLDSASSSSNANDCSSVINAVQTKSDHLTWFEQTCSSRSTDFIFLRRTLEIIFLGFCLEPIYKRSDFLNISEIGCLSSHFTIETAEYCA